MGANGSSTKGEYAMLLKDYEVTRQIESEGLIFMKNTKNGGEYLLRQFTFNDKKEFDKWSEILEKKRQLLANCKFLVGLEKVVTRTEDQYCSTFYKLYALFQFTDRTLDNQINQRRSQKRQFQETELWSILASCILGLSHLQRNGVKHESLRSNSILISRQGVVKIYDPLTTGCQTNFETLATRRSTPHIYLSPQLTDCLHSESSQPNNASYKSDIFTLGIIILEAGLSQYQDECYRDDCARIHWETVQYNIHRFKQVYSEDLTALLELMLSREEKTRPDWIQLEERVMKEEETKAVSLLNLPYPKSSRTSQLAPYEVKPKVGHITQTVIKSQANSDLNTPRHTHLYRSKPVIQNYLATPVQSIPIIPMMESPRYTMVALSQIDMTRPLRSIFPNSSYNTQTKIDENLIIVAEDDKYSEVDTPNNRNHSSYFDSNMKSGLQANVSAGYPVQTHFYNTYTPSQQIFQQQTVAPHVNTYGVSFFQSQVPKVANLNQTPTNVEQSTPSSQGQYVVERYKQGSQYKGYKFQGMRHGHGTFYYQDGGMYEGEWRFNKMQGKGKLFYQSGKLAYEGQWSNDQFSGRGVLYNEYPDVLHEPINYKSLDEIEEFWTKYQGQFLEDLKSGRGILYLSNSEYYQGDFSQDQANGEGTFLQMNGQLIRGRWLNNVFIG